MLPAHWNTLQPLLDEALDAAPGDRPALLQRWRMAFPALVDALEALLQDHARSSSDGFLAGEPAAAGLFDAPLTGQHLGAYTLLAPIGEGGMGSVWLARRADGRFEAEAAVKLLSLSIAGAGRAERFRHEGHILARLAHPHIARLLDAGVSASGQPYLILEHVRGRHIDHHCDQLRLGLAARLRLFLTLLAAVQHAHGHLVVHRDIKPSNVMVDDAGDVKLLDFGIAKLMVSDGHTAAPLTQQAGALLSPGYAAPEQLRSGEISTATDVYALGVLLYVLLSGHHPTTRPGSSAAQALHDTLQRDPLPMSQAVRGDVTVAAARGLRPATLQRALAGDLDTIVGKALRRLPAERYASVAAMADDVQRHLQQQPVLARRPGAGYVLRRFVQRHRLPVAASLLASLLLAGVGLQAWQAQQAARSSQTQAQTVDGLLQSLFRGMGPDVAASRSFSARELLDRGQAFLDSHAMLDAATQRATRLRMAVLYRDVGAFRQAAKAFQAEADAAQQSGQIAAQAMALWQWADVVLKEQDITAATQLLARLEPLLAADGPTRQLMQGRLALLQGEVALSKRHARDAALALTRAQALLDPAQDLELAARAAQALGATARLAGDITTARLHLQRSAILHGQRGDDAVVDRLTAALDLAGLENSAGQHAAALQLLTPVHADLLARLGPQHPLTISAVSELAMATLRLGQGPALSQWLQALRNGVGPEDAWRTDHADTLAAMAQLYNGQAATAEPALQRLLLALERDEGGISAATEPLRRLHAEALLRQGRAHEAETELRRTLANQQRLSAVGHPSTATTQLLLGIAQARRGDLAAAHRLWADAATVLARAYGPAHPHALAAAGYAALGAAPGSTLAAQRVVLANALQQRLGWQDGTAALAACLRDHAKAPDWRHLPVVL